MKNKFTLNVENILNYVIYHTQCLDCYEEVQFKYHWNDEHTVTTTICSKCKAKLAFDRDDDSQYLIKCDGDEALER